MKLKYIVPLLVVMIVVLNSFFGCSNQPEGTVTCCKCLENQLYDSEVSVFGTVSKLGELFCSCFILTSGGEELVIFYDTMVEDDGTERPAVDIGGIKNGDRIVVTGELKTEGVHRAQDDFWAATIEKR